MLAIYKKEVKSYLTSMVGYVFMAFILLILGIYFTAYNLNYATPDFGTTLSSVTFIFLIITPVLTMRILAEEKKNKTDQLLFFHDALLYKCQQLFSKYTLFFDKCQSTIFKIQNTKYFTFVSLLLIFHIFMGFFKDFKLFYVFLFDKC